MRNQKPGRDKGRRDNRDKNQKSGWVKPDGTPLRKRKGSYFPDEEIDSKKRKKPARTGEGRFEQSDRKPVERRDWKTEDKPAGERIRSKEGFSDRGKDGKKRYEDRENRPERSEKRFSGKKRDDFRKKPEKKYQKSRFNKTGGPARPVKSSAEQTQGGVRLNRFIANAGICSRREADELIVAGVISINGKIVTELGTKVQSGDEVKFHDTLLKTEKNVYVLLNKPKDFITTTDDPEERKTVMNLVKDACRERIFPVGRLDRNTTGLLLLTNDGALTKKLTHPSSNIKKIYQVELDNNITKADMTKSLEGVELEDGTAHFDAIEYVSGQDRNIVGVELHSGKNRIVRRVFEALGYKVKKLDRTIFAGLTKKDLPRGRWRMLSEAEVSTLKMLPGKK